MTIQTFIVLVYFALVMVALATLLVGLVYACFPGRVRVWKLRRGDFRKRKEHGERVEIRDLGIRLINIAGIIAPLLVSSAALHINFSEAKRRDKEFELRDQEFNMRNRPFLRLEPALLRDNALYELVEEEDRVRWKLFYNVFNEGPVPAYSIRISKIAWLKNPQESTETIREGNAVIFPHGDLRMPAGFLVKGVTLETIRQKVGEDPISVKVRLEYQGFKPKPERPYYSEYTVQYYLSDPKKHSIVKIDADKYLNS